MKEFSSLELGERLRTAREHAGLTQTAVARQLGMRRPSIGEIERGRRKVEAEELEAMAGLYRVGLGFLVHEVGPRDKQLVRLVADELVRCPRRISTGSLARSRS